jgi:phage-related protein
MSNTILRQVVSGDDAKQQLLHGINKSCDIIEVQLSRSECSLKLLRAT